MEKEQTNDFSPLFEEGNTPSFNIDPQRFQMMQALAKMSDGCDNVGLTLIMNEQGNLTKMMIKSNIKEYFYISSNQYTVPRNSDGGYKGILNKVGKAMYKMAKTMAAEGKFANYIEEYKIDRGYRSGCWFFDKTSKWYKPGMCNYLHSFDNKCVVGICTTAGERKPITTSPIIFYTDKWCYTKSGEVYKLGKKVDEESLDNEIRQYNEEHGIPNEY